ncbi:unnamed protein product, partial [Ascophyllum nodosum]
SHRYRHLKPRSKGLLNTLSVGSYRTFTPRTSSTRNFRRIWQSLGAIPWTSCLQILNLQESRNMWRRETPGWHPRMRHPWRLHLPRQPALVCLCSRPPPSYGVVKTWRCS